MQLKLLQKPQQSPANVLNALTITRGWIAVLLKKMISITVFACALSLCPKLWGEVSAGMCVAPDSYDGPFSARVADLDIRLSVCA